jgi:hypothetical protein
MDIPMQQQPPWWRQFWPWALIAAPATAVVAGFATLFLALQSADSLVVDDYYKEGKAINLTLARDRRATELGLAAELARAPAGLRLAMRSTATPAWPAELRLRLVHATRAEFDRDIVFRALGSGHYVAPDAALPESGHWTLQIESPGNDWRLATSIDAGAGRRWLVSAQPPLEGSTR